MSSTLKVTDARVARLLEDGRRRRLLLSLVPQERSLKELAGLNGTALNLAHYHVRQLVDYGLVEVTREQPRAGRAVRFYRARYSAFFIPASLLRSRPADKVASSLASALQHARDLAGGGVIFDVDEAGRARMRELSGEGPPALEIWRRLNLSRSDAASLFDELASVVHRFEQKSGANRSGWTIHLALGQTDP